MQLRTSRAGKVLLVAALPIAMIAASCDAQDQQPGDPPVHVSKPDARTDADASVGSDADAPPDAAYDVDASALEVSADADPTPDPGLDLGHGVLLRPSRPLAGQPVTIEYHGPLELGSNVHLHYGFNGWNEVAGPTLSSADDGTGNLDFFVESPMTRSSSGAWSATVTLPAEARALHLVFFSEAGGTRTWDANGGLDFNAGLPLVLFGPALTWDGTVQPHDGIVVNFHTGWPCKASVSYGLGGALTQSATESTAARGHFVRLAGLQPGSRYSYRVACDGLADPALRSFDTAVADAAKFEFVVLGDIQENGEANRWRRTADLVQKNHPHASFLLLTGDQPANDKTGFWWSFFDQARELLSSHPILPTKGNHDVNLGNPAKGETSFERLFQLDRSSGSETWYSVRYGAAAFLVLDGEYPEDLAKDVGAQYSWARSATQDPKVAGATWAFASLHRPPYNAGARHFGEQGAYRDATALFDGKVDWVFSGHEHLHQRMKPMRYNAAPAASGRYGRGPTDGVGYLVVPAGAAWPEGDLIASSDAKAYYRDRLAFPANPSGTSVVPSENGWVVVSVDGKSIRIQTWGAGGPDKAVDPHVVDQVEYAR